MSMTPNHGWRCRLVVRSLAIPSALSLVCAALALSAAATARPGHAGPRERDSLDCGGNVTLALVHVPAGEFVMGYEEFVFRGFLLAALTAVFGFWPAAILSSLAFGAACPIPAGIPGDYLGLRPDLVLDREAYRQHLDRMDCAYEPRLVGRPVRRLTQPGWRAPRTAPSILDANRRLRDVLLAKGYPMTYTEVEGGHHAPDSWRLRMPVGLVTLSDASRPAPPAATRR